MVKTESVFDRTEISHGEASKLLDVHPNTLRSWVDSIEEIGVHYLNRNTRGERIYNEQDVQIYKLVKDLRDKFKRSITVEEIAAKIQDQFECNTSYTEFFEKKGTEAGGQAVSVQDSFPMVNPEEFKTMSIAITEVASGIKDLASGMVNIQRHLTNSDERVKQLEQRLFELEQTKQLETKMNEERKKLGELEDRVKEYETMGFWDRLKYAIKGPTSK